MSMADFLLKIGSTADFKKQTFEVAIDWISVLFEVDQMDSWRTVEQANGLRDKVIKEIHWIKPTQLCTPGQRTEIGRAHV